MMMDKLVCKYTYIYICVYIYIHTRIYIHVYIPTRIHAVYEGLFHGLRTFSSASDHQSSKYLVDFNPTRWCQHHVYQPLMHIGEKTSPIKKNIFSEWTWKPCDIHLVTNTFVPWSSQVSWSPLVIPFGNPFELSFLTVQEVATTKITRPWWDHHDLAGYSSGKLAGWPTPLKIMVYCLMGLMIVIQWDIMDIPSGKLLQLRTWK